VVVLCPLGAESPHHLHEYVLPLVLFLHFCAVLLQLMMHSMFYLLAGFAEAEELGFSSI
jgi:hypothetical protein